MSDEEKAEDGLGDKVHEKAQMYGNMEGYWEKIKPYYEKIEALFSRDVLRDYVFAPFAKVFHLDKDLKDPHVYAIITQVAVSNAVMAGLPGKMGVGVFVSMALEIWMAYSIGKRVGLKIDSPQDTLKYFTILGGILITVFEGFRWLLGFGFSLFSWFPGNPLIAAELLVTNLVGVIFWVGFLEAKETGSFTVPVRMALEIWNKVKGISEYQWSILKNVLNPSNIKLVCTRIWSWLNGEMVIPTPVVRDEEIVALMGASLVAGNYDQLSGLVGQQFVQSIKDLYPDLNEAPLQKISARMGEYGENQMTGVLSNIKGRLFERLAAAAENSDHDAWIAKLHENRSHPSTDLILENQQTGEQFELSLKATDNPAYVEHALAHYPHDPILVTSEAGNHFAHDPRVYLSDYSNEHLEHVTQQNFDELLAETHRHYFTTVASGVAIGSLLALWPFVAAWLRKRISGDQLTEAFKRCLGQSGLRLAQRIIMSAAMGPIYIWYLLAKTSMTITAAAGDD